MVDNLPTHSLILTTCFTNNVATQTLEKHTQSTLVWNSSPLDICKMNISIEKAEAFLHTISAETRGPGGAVAIVKDGELFSSRVWGYADLDSRICMSERTLMPICSISKHLLVLALMDLIRENETNGDPWRLLDKELRKMMPQLFANREDDGTQLKVKDLFNMQSGIRDYWAMTVLWGAKPEDPFSATDDAPKALERTRSFHFSPGSEFSYSNVNFHILGRLMEKVSGSSVGQLLAKHLFIPAGMKTAALCPNTAGLPLPIKGHEGTESSGYVEARNRIEWVGDAAITASLEDMIAYEKYLHRSWDDENSLYHAIAESAAFKDGNWASYSHGLWHGFIGEHKSIGHTGSLRGFRMARFHVPDARLSAIVMLNHEANARATSQRILKFMLGALEEESSSRIEAVSAWKGDYFDKTQQRVISVNFSEKKHEVMVDYSGGAEPVKLTTPETAESSTMKARIEGDSLHIEVPGDNVKLVAQRIPTPSTAPASDFGGEYYCEEVDSAFSCDDSNAMASVAYGSFSGYLGKGPIHQMWHIGEDKWLLLCRRSMDAPAPGAWTVVFLRDDKGNVKGATIGCWLARKLEFVRKA